MFSPPNKRASVQYAMPFGAIFSSPVEMAASGFRLPQFSEDFAWLPAWLQPYQKFSLQENTEDSDKSSQFSGKNLIVHEKGHVETPGKPLCSREGSEYSSFHLFLSGESCPTAAATFSSANLLSFHLHLSSLTVPESASPIRDTLQQGGSVTSNVHVTSEQDNKETNVRPGVSIMPGRQPVKFDTLPIPKILAKCRSKSIDKKIRKQQEEIFNDAVKLSIAASEALAISELLKSEPLSKISCATTIIETALKIKQARNEHCLSEIDKISADVLHEVDETNEVCELDEIFMKEAFEDVGVQIHSGIDRDSNIVEDNCLELTASSLSADLKRGDSSSVNGSLVPNTLTDMEKVERQDVKDSFYNLERSGDRVFLPKQTEELHLEPDTMFQNSLFDVPSSNTNAIFMGNSAGTGQDKSVLTDPKVLGAGDSTLKKEVVIKARFRNEDVDADDGGDRANCISGERFRSHWLGGWTGEVTKARDAINDVHEIFNGKKSIPKYFQKKVSYISESIVLATVESSVDKPEVEPIAKDPLVNKEILTSQDFVGSSNFSSVDPLCSIVPCSIPSDNDKEHTIPHDFYQKSLGDALENCINSERLLVETEGSDSKMGTLTTKPVIKWKQLASLVAYSKLGLTQTIDLRERFCHKELPECAAEGINPKLSSDNASLAEETRRDAEIRGLAGSKKNGNTEDNSNRRMDYLSPVKHKLTESNPHKPDSDLRNAVRQSPIVLNHGCRRRLRASKLIPNDGGEKLSEGNRMQENKHRRESAKKRARHQFQPKFENITSCLHLSTSEPFEPNKRVRFAKNEFSVHQYHTEHRESSEHQNCSCVSFGKRKRGNGIGCSPKIREGSYNLISCWRNVRTRQIFQGLKFLLTGYSQQKERELEMTIRKNGGVVLNDFPSPLLNMRRGKRSGHGKDDLPLVLSPEKNQTVTFLYGCAVNALLLRTDWVIDSVKAGYLLSPNTYLILSHQEAEYEVRAGKLLFHVNYHRIFAGVGIMFYGKPSFCTTFVKIVKRGGGQVFKTLHWLVQSLKSGRTSLGAVVIEDDSCASRHLQQCVLEHRLKILHANWVIKCLHSGKVVEANICQ